MKKDPDSRSLTVIRFYWSWNSQCWTALLLFWQRMWKVMLPKCFGLLLSTVSPCRNICFISRLLSCNSKSATSCCKETRQNWGCRGPWLGWKSLRNLLRRHTKPTWHSPVFPSWFCYPFSCGLTWITWNIVPTPYKSHLPKTIWAQGKVNTPTFC